MLQRGRLDSFLKLVKRVRSELDEEPERMGVETPIDVPVWPGVSPFDPLQYHSTLSRGDASCSARSTVCTGIRRPKTGMMLVI